MVASAILSRIHNQLAVRPAYDPFPEVKTHAEINKAREIWGEPPLEVREITLEEAFERGRFFLAKIIELEIEKIKTDIARGL